MIAEFLGYINKVFLDITQAYVKSPDSIDIDACLDVISYVISTGIISKIAGRLKQIHTAVEDNQNVCDVIFRSASFISIIGKLLQKLKNKSSCELVTAHFVQACEQTDFACIIPCLYTILVLSGTAEPRPTIFDGSQFGDDQAEREKSLLVKSNRIIEHKLPISLVKVTFMSLEAINACLGLKMKLERVASPHFMTLHLFRHIFNYLLWHLVKTDENNAQALKIQSQHEEDIILAVIQLIGSLCLNNPEHQKFVGNGIQPTVLKQLCGLPFSFINKPKKRRVLFPTLFAVCYKDEDNTKFLVEASGLSTALFDEVAVYMKNEPIFEGLEEPVKFWEEVKSGNYAI